MKEEFKAVMEEIDQLIANNDFPQSVLKDVVYRLKDCQEPAYARQQLTFLKFVKRDFLDKQVSNEA